VIETGFEPVTVCLEVSKHSIALDFSLLLLLDCQVIIFNAFPIDFSFLPFLEPKMLPNWDLN